MKKVDIKNYKELRGTINKKDANLLKKHYFVVSDEKNQATIFMGEGLFDMYSVGEQVTIGYIGKKLVNIRKGICKK